MTIFQPRLLSVSKICRTVLPLKFVASILAFAFGLSTEVAFPVDPESKSDEPQTLQTVLENELQVLNRWITEHGASLQQLSARGDVLMFLGRFSEAVADYQEMIKLDPAQDASHWRLGIALFYDGKAEQAAAQFDRYHTFDQIDRENGIWRYFSHHKAHGKDAARKQLLKYEKDDREPFGDLYRLFSGDRTSQQILKQIGTDEIPAIERQKRMFYAELYIGLNDVLENRPDSAKQHLRAAVENPWPQRAGYGPNYMWHVGRLQLQLLKDD
ncbi:tetratricopeptide repeat protein [Planctomicrobium sp. SH661]|uniref:tetratricopeptide repeat protein n=1 Tax=Planctomicrobium sp. SH661 TaxID=3448124 RepID=UPI003F5CAD6F